MREPRRLSHREDLGGDLLRSARKDAPTRAARRRTAVVLGLAVGAAAGSATTSVTAATAPATKFGGLGGIAALVKWLGLGAVGGAMAFGTVKYVAPTLLEVPPPKSVLATPATSARPSPSHGSRATSAVMSPALAPIASVPSSSPPMVAPEVRPLPSSFPAVAAAPSTPPVATRSSSLADEVRLLDRAGAALSAGDPRSALDAIDAHDRTFQDGALAQEADVIRIEALAASGDDSNAAARARAFLTTFPHGAQADHVRSVLGAIESEKKP